MAAVKIQGAEVAENSGALAASYTIGKRLKVYDIIVSNTKATEQYVHVFDSATLPADTAVPLVSLRVPADSVGSLSWPAGRPMVAGVSVCNSSTKATKTIGSADCFFDVTYQSNY